MTKSKNTKRALLASVLSMLLCVAMLIGSTFAWFTDSVTSGKNKIVAGNLDIELNYRNASMTSFKEVKADTEDLFVTKEGEVIRWEPGAAAVTYLELKNAGNLALKYQLSVDAADTVTGTDGAALSKVLKIAVVEITEAEVGTYDRATAVQKAEAADAEGIRTYSKPGEMETQGQVKYLAMIVYFPAEIGNTYEGAVYNRSDVELKTELSLKLVATQKPYENDSFGNNYDENAEYPIIPVKVATADEFVEAIGNGEDVALTEDIALTETVAVTNDVTIYANGKTITTAANRLMWADSDDVTVTIDNANFVSTNNSSNSRGLQINPNKSNVDLIIKNSKITMNNVGDNYGVNICGGVANSSLTLINCEITAYQCVNIYGRDMTVNIDGCTFTYVNKHNKGWAGGFITLFCGEGCENIDLTVKNTQFITGTVADGCVAPKAPVYYNKCTGSHNHTTTVENCTLDGVAYSNN